MRQIIFRHKYLLVPLMVCFIFEINNKFNPRFTTVLMFWISLMNIKLLFCYYKYLTCVFKKTIFCFWILDAKDKLGYTAIYKYLKQVKLPIVPNFFNKSLTNDFKFDWLSTEVLINKIFGMDTFLHLVVDASIYQRNSNVIYMGMPAAGSPLPT